MSWRPTLRIAARNARRAKARSILIVAMIGLPVFAIGFVDVMWRTSVPSAQEDLTYRLGASQALLEVAGGPNAEFLQAPDPQDGYTNVAGGWTSVGGSPEQYGASRDLNELKLPAAARLVSEVGTSVGLRTRSGVSTFAWTEADLTDPVFVGRWTMLAGHPPQSPQEVVLTAPLLERTGLTIGDSLALTDPVGNYTVVGVVEQGGFRGLSSVVAAPGSLIGRPGGVSAQFSTTRLFVANTPIAWDNVLALNSKGVLVTSRAVLLDPPGTTPFSESGVLDMASSSSDYLIVVLVGAVIAALVILEVVLLAGAAFAVGARRQAHSLALVAASGGSRRDLRRTVLGGGVVLGLTAGVLGVLLAIVGAFATRAALLAWTTVNIAAFDVRPLELLAVVAFALVTGILAAVVPARQASRMDVVAALRGQRGSPPPSRRTPVVGIVMVVVGVVLSVVGSGWAVAAQQSGKLIDNPGLIAAPIVAGAALVVLGLVVCSGTVVSVTAKLAARLPLAGRLALRDADRHRGRSAPAVAAILAAVSGSVAVMLYVAALDQHDRDTYTPQAPVGTATVDLRSYQSDARGESQEESLLDPAKVTAAVQSTLANKGVVEITTPWCADGACPDTPFEISPPKENRCPGLPAGATEQEWTELAQTDPRCAQNWVAYSGLRGNTVYAVGGPEMLTLTGQTAAQEASAMLAAGGVVVADPLLIDSEGKVHIRVRRHGSQPASVLRVPGVAVPAENMAFTVVLPQSLVRSMDVQTGVTSLLIKLSGPVSTDAEDATRAALEATFGTNNAYFYVERGYESTYGIGLLALALAAGIVTLGATGIATGLALTDARADHATLAAVGAAPRLRRRLAGAQALTLGFLGVVLGIIAGIVPAVSLIGAITSLAVVWPWPQLVGLVLGVPLLSGAFAFVFTRSRVPMQRRIVA